MFHRMISTEFHTLPTQQLTVSAILKCVSVFIIHRRFAHRKCSFVSFRFVRSGMYVCVQSTMLKSKVIEEDGIMWYELMRALDETCVWRIRLSRAATQREIKQKRCSSHSLTSHYYQLLRKIKIATLCLSCSRCESKNEPTEKRSFNLKLTYRFRPFFIWTLTFHLLLRSDEAGLSYENTYCLSVYAES